MVTASTAVIVLAVSSHTAPLKIDVDCSVKVARGAGPLEYGVCVNYLISDTMTPSTGSHSQSSWAPRAPS